jgi:hypothetical protein
MLGAMVVVGGLAVACGDDPFSAADAVGVWDVTRWNGAAVPGEVWIRIDNATDSVQVDLEALSFEFMSAPDCAYTSEIVGQGTFESDDCAYAVADDGGINITVAGEYSITGTADGDEMTLSDEDTNAFVLRRRV